MMDKDAAQLAVHQAMLTGAYGQTPREQIPETDWSKVDFLEINRMMSHD